MHGPFSKSDRSINRVEPLDRTAAPRALHPVVQRSAFVRLERGAILHAAAAGYSPPTNLGTEMRVVGAAPESPPVLMTPGMDEGITTAEAVAVLANQNAGKQVSTGMTDRIPTGRNGHPVARV